MVDKHLTRSNIALAIMISLALALCATVALPASAHAIAKRGTDVSTPAAGNVLLGLDGTFSSDGKAAVLKRVNQIRQEACKKGVPRPDDPTVKLTPADYVPMKWSKTLECIAQTRAAEATLQHGHERPCGGYMYDAYPSAAIYSQGETLAWNYSGMLAGVEQWYGEMADWVAQKEGAVTGHYEIMIDPDFTHIGLGAFEASDGGWTCVAGEYYRASPEEAASIPEEEIGAPGLRRQLIEVPKSKVGKLVITGNTTFKGAASHTFTARVQVASTDVYGNRKTTNMVPNEAITWASSNMAAAAVSSAGKVTVKKCGPTKITATSAGLGKTASVSLKVTPAPTKVKSVVAKKKALTITRAFPSSLATGFQIRYSTTKSMKGAKTVTVKGAAKKTKTIKKLKAKKRYYVQVRSIATVNGKTYYSAWSGKKSKKTKK